MLDQSRGIPRTEFPDATLALLREGYAFVSRQCDALRSDAFRTRLMLRKVVCLRGPEAGRLLYGLPHLTRVGAMPLTVLKLLQDKGSVQQLDGAPHLHRKAVFVAQLMYDQAVEKLAALFRKEWLAALPHWRARGEVDLMSGSNLLLTRAATQWTGIPDGWFRTDELATKLANMVESTGHFGPKTFATLLARRTVERRLVALVADIRRGRIVVPDGTALSAIAGLTHVDGSLLDPEICAVELINMLRPIAAISRYIVYAALALEQNPDWAARFAEGSDVGLEAFVEEVRRFYPFFPVVGAVAKSPFGWAGREWKEGQWFLLDLYGTTHDPRNFPSPASFRPERDLSWRNQDYSFVPQGAGVTSITHRCPGEKITVRLMMEAALILTREMHYRLPEAASRVPLDKIPARPERTTIRIN